MLSEKDLAQMRVRDLKTLLRALGASSAQISVRLDKNDLVDLALDLSQDAEIQKNFEASMSIGKYLAIMICVVTICYYYLPRSLVENMFYKQRIKIKLLASLSKRFLFLGSLMMCLSIFLECVIPLIQLSTLLSWVIPRSSHFHSYLIPSIPFSVNPTSILGQQNMSDFSLNIGPMITLWILQVVVNRLDEYSSGILLRNESFSNKTTRSHARKRNNIKTSPLDEEQEWEQILQTDSESFQQESDCLQQISFIPMNRQIMTCGHQLP